MQTNFIKSHSHLFLIRKEITLLIKSKYSEHKIIPLSDTMTLNFNPRPGKRKGVFHLAGKVSIWLDGPLHNCLACIVSTRFSY
jgi:hypothetical protein